MKKTMTEKTRKASLMNQSLMSQSLSDLRNPPSRHSGEWKMFASDSDIKDIAEVIENVDSPPGAAAAAVVPLVSGITTGSNESVSTLHVSSGSGTCTATNTPRKEKDDPEDKVPNPNISTLTDINANPRVAHSTPVRKLGDNNTESVSPMSETVESEQGMVTSTMSGSSRSSGVQLSQLYTDICEQKDVIMSCLDEDNCDIDQVQLIEKTFFHSIF